MARRATYSLAYVNAVIEVHVIRQPMHLHPLNRSICPVTLANWFQIADVIEENRMAAHAGFSGRNSSRRRRLNRRMTVAAINSVIARVMFVAELHWLRAHNVLPRKIRRTRQPQHRRQGQTAGSP